MEGLASKVPSASGRRVLAPRSVPLPHVSACTGLLFSGLSADTPHTHFTHIPSGKASVPRAGKHSWGVGGALLPCKPLGLSRFPLKLLALPVWAVGGS